jgi:hypothetical protein
MTKFYRSSESGPEELVLTPRGADDLIAKLRTSATDLCSPDGCCYAETMVEAANEIECIRAALAAAQAVAPVSPAIETLKSRIDHRLNNVLCGMREGFDDSIVGFNEAWDIVRAVFKELPARAPWPTEEQVRKMICQVIDGDCTCPANGCHASDIARAVDAIYRNALCPKVQP